ncbi:MAG: helix-turn-helix transcriptional regulator [Kiritimatiellae bacterium]|jgi:transcriptional regulator with XRE-family HTH domain|nr:helix-turn-helix transcriptional regulator [Kiritimatiellia bacterium]
MTDTAISYNTSAIRIKGVSAVARKVGVSQAHISMILRGKRKPGTILKAKLVHMGIKPLGGKWAEQ